ncbi:MAG: DUF3883 domain-containing protein, partial [bacterium]
RYGPLINAYPKATFDKDKAFKNPDAEFLSFGHPLFEAALAWVEASMSVSLKQGAVFEDPDGHWNGIVMFYEGEIRDGKGSVAGKRLFAFYLDAASAEVKPMNPAFIWDLVEGKSADEKAIDIEALKNRVLVKLLPTQEDYKNELAKERARQSAIKEKYGVKSLEHLIVNLDGDLIKLYERREQGENVDLVIRNKEEQKKRYEMALAELKQTLVQEKILTMSTPAFVGAIRVVPAPQIDPAMTGDAEIEKIGMKVVRRYEVEQGRVPEDVSAENLGFDIRSTDSSGNKRYIEVKARAGTGAVALTQNEWFKAKRFANDYFLYVVMNAATKPELLIIQNPAENLQPEEKIELVRYIVSVDEIQNKGMRAGNKNDY